MENHHAKRDEGIRRLVEFGRKSFRRSENLNFYSEEDYKAAEKKYIKLCIIGQKS